MYSRMLTPRVREALRDTPAVAISGPRQSGKTTLSRQFAGRARSFVNLDDLSVLAAAKADPAGFIARLDGAALLTDRTRLGPILESYVFGELLKLSTIAEQELHLFHYRDKDQLEVDFIVEYSTGDLIGIEVKGAATVQASDFLALERLRSIAGDQFRQGIVLYTGTDALPYGDRLAAVPLSSLAN
jgi:predicted AAA+ superfamily ATPase